MQQPHSWSHLPDVCLLAVFKYISVSDMIRRVGRVCSNWARIQLVELKKRSKLVILEQCDKNSPLEDLRQLVNPFGSNLIKHVRRDDDGSPWAQLRSLSQYEFEALPVPGGVLTERITTPLMEHLPNITCLTLNLYFPSNMVICAMEQMIRLIDHYANTLISLKLDFLLRIVYATDEDRDIARIKVPALFDSINRLATLRHLTLNIDVPGHHYPDLSILSRLATFSCNEFHPIRSLLPSLRQYATIGDGLRIECNSGMELDEWIELDPQLAFKFTRVLVAGALIVSEYEGMGLFCARFVSLHTLELHNWTMPMTMLARCLSQLPELVHLILVLHVIPPDEQPPQLEPPSQVASVRLLTLNINTLAQSHHDTERLHLHQIFPNLQLSARNFRGNVLSV